MKPNIRNDWNADVGEKLSFPIGIGTIGMTRVSRLPMRWGLELQDHAVQPDDFGPDVNLKLFVAPIIPNPFK